ncbi:MAG: class I SAM-dependent RNA methyltransferase [Bernardetiaceae bacterium]|nr:class I SAM-dependent RNA methyltransferase [Bernardetiaceae bacterium]
MQNFEMTAQTLYGVEQILAEELKHIGAQDIQIANRAVSFSGDKALLYKANLCLHTALRILVPIHSFKVTDEQSLYTQIKAMPWEDYLDVKNTLAIGCVLATDRFHHSRFLEQKTKDAIVDRFREKYRRRPSVELRQPDLRVHLYIKDDSCLVSLDSSGESLHKRGYRQETNLAPINEVLAAALIKLSHWDKKTPLIDPMCGSGTLLTEAALIAAQIPPGSFKSIFGFEKWKDFDADIWEQVYDEAMDGIKDSELPLILGGEISKNVARKAQKNILEANLGKYIQIKNIAFQDFLPPENHSGGMLIMNPPYGERMDKEEDIKAFYKEIGDVLKTNWKGYQAWIITSNLKAIKRLGLRPSQKLKVYNGSLACSFSQYELYEGSR